MSKTSFPIKGLKDFPYVRLHIQHMQQLLHISLYIICVEYCNYLNVLQIEVLCTFPLLKCRCIERQYYKDPIEQVWVELS